MKDISAGMSALCFILFFALGISVHGGCQETSVESQSKPVIDQVLAEIKNEFAPDRRVAIWDVTAKGENPTVLVGQTNLDGAKQALLSRLQRAQVDVVDSVQVLSFSPALVNISVCNIRSQPRHSAELATQSLLGTPLKIYKQSGSWYYVQTPEGYLGWLDSGGLEPMSDQDMNAWKTGKRVVVKVAFAFVKSHKSQMVVSDVTEGNILQWHESQGEFHHVSFPDGRSGLIEKKFVQDYHQFIVPAKSSLEPIISTAMEFLGRPYLWGGTSGKAMDCSGFTKTVYYLNGFILPRDASQQVHAGVEIQSDTSLINLLPGDFLFFGRKATPKLKEKITHVGIYLGAGKMIHSSERVRIQSLKRGDQDFAENRLNTFVRAKRMLNNVGSNGVIKLIDHPDYRPE